MLKIAGLSRNEFDVLCDMIENYEINPVLNGILADPGAKPQLEKLVKKGLIVKGKAVDYRGIIYYFDYRNAKSSPYWLPELEQVYDVLSTR